MAIARKMRENIFRLLNQPFDESYVRSELEKTCYESIVYGTKIAVEQKEMGVQKLGSAASQSSSPASSLVFSQSPYGMENVEMFPSAIPEGVQLQIFQNPQGKSEAIIIHPTETGR